MARIEKGKVVVPCKAGNYPLEERLFDEGLKGVAMVWAVLDCHRDDIQDDLSEEI